MLTGATATSQLQPPGETAKATIQLVQNSCFKYLICSRKENLHYTRKSCLILGCAGKGDLHLPERSEEFVRAEAAQTTAAGGGQRTGRLHWYGAVSMCVRMKGISFQLFIQS